MIMQSLGGGGGGGGRVGQTRCTMGDVQMENSLVSTYQIVRAL